MKRLLTIIFLISLTTWTGTPVLGQDIDPNRVSVNWSDPSRPGTVEVHLFNGGISVKTHNGRDVIVQSRMNARGNQNVTSRGNRGNRGGDNPDTTGLRRIDSNATIGLTIEEENNEMEISSSPFDGGRCCRDVEILVPARTNLKLTSMNGGSITVDGVEGEMEIQNMNGAVTVTNVAGSVMAHSMNGRVTASLRQVTANKPMSFTSMNGNVDVTLPASTKANLQLRANNGEIHSNFDVQVRPNKPRIEDTRQKGGELKIEIDTSLAGSINGGGPEFELRTFNGNIYIRQGK